MAFSLEMLRAASAEAANFFKNNKRVVGHAIGDQIIRVYVLDEKTSKTIPKAFKDVPVTVIISGPVVAL